MAGIFNRNIKNKYIEEVRQDLVGDGSVVTAIDITSAGTGYAANATVSFEFGAAIASSIASSAGKITSASVAYGGTFYQATPSITFSAPLSESFNANSAVTNGVSTGLSTDANSTISVAFVSAEFNTPVFEVGDAIIYTTSTGNTAISPLTSGTTYYVQHANTTKIALAITPTGNRITLTKGFTESGHSLRGVTATGTSTIASSGSNYYITFGKFFEWDDDNNPPATNTSIKESFYDVYSNMLFGKKVSENDIGYIAKRITWTTGTVYDYYSHLDPDLYQKNFYVVNSLNRVYKCIFNNYGATSTVEPNTTQTSGTFTLADGYIWKFLFNIPGASINKFSTATYFPVVPNSTVARQAIKGAIHNTVLTNTGKNYISANGSIDVVIDTKNFKVANSGASIINGAYAGSSLYVYSGTGSPALAVIDSYVVNTSGKFVTTSSDINGLDSTSLYRINPRVLITGDGTGASAYSLIDSDTGKLQSINMLNTGRNYSYATVTISANAEFGSGGAAYSIISPPGGHGSDVISELGTDIMGISVETKPTDEFPSWATYRQIGLLFNPRASSNSTLFSGSKFDYMLNFELFNTTDIFNAGDTIRGLLSKATATVAFMNTTSMYVLNSEGTFRSYETIISGDTGKTCTITIINNPELVPYSGEIFYYKNIQPINRASITKEQVKLYFNF